MANSLSSARLVAVAFCSLALTGCPQVLQDDFKVVTVSDDAGEATDGDAGNYHVNAAAGGTNGLDGGVGGTTNNAGGANSTGGTGGGTGGLCTTGRFAYMDLVTGLNVTGSLWAPTLSANDLSLYFSVWDGNADRIYVATRPGRGAVFLPATPVQILGNNSIQASPFLSSNGLNMYFISNSQLGTGDRDIWVASRTNTNIAIFSDAQSLAGVNSTSYENRPWLSDDEVTTYFASDRLGGAGGHDIWTATRDPLASSFSTPTNLASINGPDDDVSPSLSKDGLTLYFSSTRPGGWGKQDIWTATRPDEFSNFEPATNLSAINSESEEVDVALSHDEAELFFASDWSATINSSPSRIWRATRYCVDTAP